MNKFRFYGGLIVLSIGMQSVWAAKLIEDKQPLLTESGQRIEAHYAKQLENLRSQIVKEIPFVPAPTTDEARKKELDFPDVELGSKKKDGDNSLEELLGGGKKAGSKGKGPTRRFLRELRADWGDAFDQIVPAHYDAPVRGTADDVVAAFSFLDAPDFLTGLTAPGSELPEEDMGTLLKVNDALEFVGLGKGSE